MEIIASNGFLFLALACVFGLFMAWGIGANDVANAMGTSVGSKALTLKQAIIIAAIFEFAGAYLAGGEVTATIRKGIIDPAVLSDSPELLVFGMLSALLAAATWLLIASIGGWPVSTTHSIVGGIVGFAAVGISVDAVDWGKVGEIAGSWVVSPVLAGTLAFLLFISVKKLIFDHDNTFERARRYVPVYMWMVGFMISMVTLLKGLKHIGLDLTLGMGSAFADAMVISAVIGLIVAAIGALILGKITPSGDLNSDANIERVFGILMIFTACGMAFAHGSNDVANAVVRCGSREYSPIRWRHWRRGDYAVVGIGYWCCWHCYRTGHLWLACHPDHWTKITELTPSRGFAAELAAASTVVLASATGLPISTTHTLVGAVLGVGLARGVEAVSLPTIGKIFASWLVTLPAGAGLAIVFFYLLSFMFGA